MSNTFHFNIKMTNMQKKLPAPADCSHRKYSDNEEEANILTTKLR
jgi:hypothetical protein